MSIQETRAKFGTFSLFYLQVLQSAGNLALGHFSFLVFTREAQNNNFNLPFFSVSLETLFSVEERRLLLLCNRDNKDLSLLLLGLNGPRLGPKIT